MYGFPVQDDSPPSTSGRFNLGRLPGLFLILGLDHPTSVTGDTHPCSGDWCCCLPSKTPHVTSATMNQEGGLYYCYAMLVLNATLDEHLRLS
jgi:hypothetical protein